MGLEPRQRDSQGSIIVVPLYLTRTLSGVKACLLVNDGARSSMVVYWSGWNACFSGDAASRMVANGLCMDQISYY